MRHLEQVTSEFFHPWCPHVSQIDL